MQLGNDLEIHTYAVIPSQMEGGNHSTSISMAETTL